MEIKDFPQPLEGNYRIERDNSHSVVNAYWIKERIDECETLRQQLAESQALVAKLTQGGDRLCHELECWMATEHDRESQEAMDHWKRLRQAADEAERAGGER